MTADDLCEAIMRTARTVAQTSAPNGAAVNDLIAVGIVVLEDQASEEKMALLRDWQQTYGSVHSRMVKAMDQQTNPGMQLPPVK